MIFFSVTHKDKNVEWTKVQNFGLGSVTSEKKLDGSANLFDVESTYRIVK